MLLLVVGAASTAPPAASAYKRVTYCTRHYHPRGCVPIPTVARRPPNRNQQGPATLTPSGVEAGGGLGGGPGNHRRTALSWARSQLKLARWAWRCERFVEEAYGTRDRFDSARQAASTLPLHHAAIGDAPPGSLVFFAADRANRGLGHVGLSVGHGKMISALSQVEITDVAHSRYWQSARSQPVVATVTVCSPYQSPVTNATYRI